jgi:cytoskeletal protein CcmA (bactofilin family)
MFTRQAKVITTATAIDSIISKDTVVQGPIESVGSLKVYGIINGNISPNEKTVSRPGDKAIDFTVVSEKDSVVHGDIMATNVIIAGTVYGKIKAKSVFIEKSAHVGDIEYELLQVEAGARIHGVIQQLPNVNKTTEVNNVEPIRSIKQ